MLRGISEADQANLGGKPRPSEQKCGYPGPGTKRQPDVAEQCWKHNTEHNPVSFVKGAPAP